MIVSWNWLTDYIRLDMPVEVLAERLALSGLNHESTSEVGGDLAIDLEVTSNRSDCLGHIGVAREIAVIFDRALRIPPTRPQASGPSVESRAGAAIEAGDLCRRFTARVVSGVKPGERIVTNGNFLIDSQTRLTGGMTGMFGGSKEFGDHPIPGGGTSEPPAAKTAKITYRTDPDPLQGAAPAKFYVQLVDATGKAIADAQLRVTLVMPPMPSMNMPEMRATADLSWNGNEYSGTINVPMAGSWTATIEATHNGQVLASQHVRLAAR